MYEFPYRIRNEDVVMVVTSVTGHLMELDFTGDARSWGRVEDETLLRLNTPVEKRVPDGKKDIAKTLEREMRNCARLVLWLDCDSEGENIGFEVLQVCQHAKNSTNFPVFRAKFSSLVPQEVTRAVQTLVQPDARVSESVDARREMDLRIGAAFTRFQTRLVENAAPAARQWLKEGSADPNRGPLISYGPCQFPTLGFVVARDWEIQNHVAEDFWTIRVAHRFPAAPATLASGAPQPPPPQQQSRPTAAAPGSGI